METIREALGTALWVWQVLTVVLIVAAVVAGVVTVWLAIAVHLDAHADATSARAGRHRAAEVEIRPLTDEELAELAELTERTEGRPSSAGARGTRVGAADVAGGRR